MSVFEINPNVFRPNLVSKFSEILEDEKKATNLEKAIYNYTIKEASTRRLVKKWENPWFMHLYCDRLRTIYFNLKNCCNKYVFLPFYTLKHSFLT